MLLIRFISNKSIFNLHFCSLISYFSIGFNFGRGAEEVRLFVTLKRAPVNNFQVSISITTEHIILQEILFTTFTKLLLKKYKISTYLKILNNSNSDRTLNTVEIK